MASDLLLSPRPPFSLDLCLTSGQSFAWRCEDGWWLGTILRRGFAVRQVARGLEFRSTQADEGHAHRLGHYFALDENHSMIVASFPKDRFLLNAVRSGRGLRVLRQDPWECLAGFILSSTKQILQIQQIWRALCERWGERLEWKGWVECGGHPPILHSFPEASRLARCSEVELRACRMGFRAPYLLRAARAVAEGRVDLAALRGLPTEEARARLMELDGVGRKIADCVLLFSLGKAEAFPVDTWILKVLRTIYFRRKRTPPRRELLRFVENRFGPYAGHAQQYLYHYARMNPLFRHRLLTSTAI